MKDPFCTCVITDTRRLSEYRKLWLQSIEEKNIHLTALPWKPFVSLIREAQWKALEEDGHFRYFNFSSSGSRVLGTTKSKRDICETPFIHVGNDPHRLHLWTRERRGMYLFSSENIVCSITFSLINVSWNFFSYQVMLIYVPRCNKVVNEKRATWELRTEESAALCVKRQGGCHSQSM